VEFKGVQKPAGTSDQMMLFLDSIIPSLLEVNVLGGEPFIEKDQYVFLEKLIEMEKFDVSLRVNTNLSQLSLGDKQILTYLKKFQQVFVCVSCDGAGAQGELIRHGMKWDQFKENFRILQKSGIAHGIVVTVSVLNAFHIIDFIRILLKENMLFDGKQLILNILAEFCTDNIKILNHNEIMALEEKYSDFILNDLITFNLVNSDLLVGQLKNVIKFARSKPDSWDIAYERRKFVIHTLQLDGMRGERFLKLFPEYNQLFLEVIPTLGKN
jgi:sulfatase maturation enzyme AslB (radical SAM superfamily)